MKQQELVYTFSDRIIDHIFKQDNKGPETKVTIISSKPYEHVRECVPMNYFLKSIQKCQN